MSNRTPLNLISKTSCINNLQENNGELRKKKLNKTSLNRGSYSNKLK